MAWLSYLTLSSNKILSYPVFALSGLGVKNDVSRVKRWWWNKKVRETLL